jgi:2'-5' RNA ligase
MLGTIRAFFSLDIEDQAIMRKLTKIQGMLVNTGVNLKIVKPQNIHLTIRFLGNISPSIVDAIHQEMKQLSFTTFEIELVGLGVFPKLTHPRIVWVGIRKGADQLKDVFEQLEPRLMGLGFKPDRKGFSPHLTIARLKGGRNKSQLIKLILEMENYEFGIVKAKCLRLKKSGLTSRGPIYSTLKEVYGD